MLGVAGCELRVTGCGLRVAGFVDDGGDIGDGGDMYRPKKSLQFLIKS